MSEAVDSRVRQREKVGSGNKDTQATDETATTDFELCGVVVHHGYSVHGGHYVAYVKSSAGPWYEMDDEEVRMVSLQVRRSLEKALTCY